MLTVGLCLFACAMLSACGPSTVIGAGAIAGNAAMQERGFVKTVEDTAIEAKIGANLLSYSAELFVDVSAEVYEGRALLTGKVKQTKDRIEAVRIAWNVSGVKEVINEIQVEDTSDLLDAARDHWITAELSTKITLDNKIKGINYSIDTVNGTVYIMGIAQSQAELDRVRNHARQLSYVRRIISYVRIKNKK
jgi:osmotically-inducible protein OsmY